MVNEQSGKKPTIGKGNSTGGTSTQASVGVDTKGSVYVSSPTSANAQMKEQAKPKNADSRIQNAEQKKLFASSSKQTKAKNNKRSEDVEFIEKMQGGSSVNLIPKLTQKEEKVEESTSKLNIGAALSIFLFVLLSVVVVGYNLLTKLELNKLETKLAMELEPKVLQRSDEINKNAQINERLDMFSSVKEEAIPYKEVLQYWREISKDMGHIETIKLSSGLHFLVSGQADSLEDVAKLWHYLSVNEAVETVNLNQVSQGVGNAPFKFEGVLDYQYFVK